MLYYLYEQKLCGRMFRVNLNTLDEVKTRISQQVYRLRAMSESPTPGVRSPASEGGSPGAGGSVSPRPRSNSQGELEADVRRVHAPVRHTRSWTQNGGEPLISARGPLKSHLGARKEESLVESEEHPPVTAEEMSGPTPPEPARMREIITNIDTECTCTYAVSRLWYKKWEEYVGMPKGSTPGKSEPPGPMEMDTHNDANNEYIHEDIWKLFVHWFSVAPAHQLDRRHLYFKDEKMFDVCMLSPFSGIVEHNVKKFNRFEEIGYIECQLRRVFNVPDHKKSRLWISEKAQVPRFRHLLLRFRMLNDCIHRDKMYILALEVGVGPGTWPTGEPGEPKGELTKYKDIITGPRSEDYWSGQITTSLDTLTLSVTDSVHQMAECFLQNAQTLLQEREHDVEAARKNLDTKLEETEAKEKFLDEKARQVAKNEEILRQEKDKMEKERGEFQAQKQKFETEISRMAEMHQIQESRIKLDIGGHTYTTSITTLRRDPESMLAAMFSGRHDLQREPDGSYFIDRDGIHFRHILNFLRDGQIDAETLPRDPVTLKELLREAKYYQLANMVSYLEETLQGNGK